MLEFFSWTLVIIASGALLWFICHIHIERKKELQCVQEQQRAELRRNYWRSLVHTLKTTPLKAFEIHGFNQRCSMPEDIVKEVTEELYTQLYVRAVADGVMTSRERHDLEKLVQALQLSTTTREAIESQQNQEVYQRKLHESLDDGIVSTQEGKQLDELRQCLGLSREAVRNVSYHITSESYLARFREAAFDGQFSQSDVADLARLRDVANLSEAETYALIRNDAFGLFQQLICEIRQDGRVTAEEERELENLQTFLGLSHMDVHVYQNEVKRIKDLDQYRNGNLPRTETTALLEGGEICHWENDCEYIWKTRTKTWNADGRIILTSKRIIFTSQVRNFEFRPSKVVDLVLHTNNIYVQTTTSRGTGTYVVTDPELFEAILYGLVKRRKYQTVKKLSSHKSRHIPSDIKREVWAQDGGACVNCSSTDYLEYDHIIPWAKGGANTVNNLQLLCRGCNSQKGDRI